MNVRLLITISMISILYHEILSSLILFLKHYTENTLGQLIGLLLVNYWFTLVDDDVLIY